MNAQRGWSGTLQGKESVGWALGVSVVLCCRFGG